MARSTTIEILTERLQEHQAVKAWRQLQSDHRELSSIEILKHIKKSAVYRLNGIGPQGKAVIAKRCRKATANVERMIYEELLPRAPVSALRCYGFLREPEGEFCWLFLEDAAGQLYSPQLAEHRALAGRWLAETHLTPVPPDLKAHLPDRDLGHYLKLLRSSRATLLEHLARNTAVTNDDAVVLHKTVTHCDVLESHWSKLESLCDGMPRTLVHGDFVIKNVRVQNGAASPALLVFDWEYAGWGVLGTDLAQFVGSVASPDVNVYCSVLKRELPDLDARDLQAVAACGNLLRLVDEIEWATALLEFGGHRFLAKPVSTLRDYEAMLEAAMSTLSWS